MSKDQIEKNKAMAESTVTYEKDTETKIATITFDRPDKLNAPTGAMRLRYAELLDRANLDDEVKVVVIRGTGDHFGGGADLPEQSDFHSETKDEPLWEEFGIDDPDETDIKFPPVGSVRRMMSITELYTRPKAGCRSLQDFKKVSIVEAKGYCYGWHFYQCGDADLVVSSDDALFGHPAFRYAGWGPRMWTWIEMIGLRKFQEMVFTGRPFTAEQMADCGFVNSVVPREQLEDEVMKYALACSRSRPTDTIALQKTFFEMYKQYRGEYMGSQMTSWLEAMMPFVKADEAEVELGDEVWEKGLNKVVKENEKQYPPEWRVSLGGRSSK